MTDLSTYTLFAAQSLSDISPVLLPTANLRVSFLSEALQRLKDNLNLKTRVAKKCLLRYYVLLCIRDIFVQSM